MRSWGQFFLILTVIMVGAACHKKAPTATALRKPSPQVTDILKDKTHPQILETKYGGENGVVKATCTLESIQSDAPAVPGPAASEINSPIKPPGFVPPVQYPAENSVVFDLRSQYEVDKELKQAVEISLSHAKDNQVLNLKLNVAPLVFEPQLSLDIGNSKYIMKYTPVLSYTFALEVLSGDSSSQLEGEGKIYEKVLLQNTIGESVAGEDRYAHRLSCILNTAVNDDNEELGREFAEHWRCINCVGPQ